MPVVPLPRRWTASAGATTEPACVNMRFAPRFERTDPPLQARDPPGDLVGDHGTDLPPQLCKLQDDAVFGLTTAWTMSADNADDLVEQSRTFTAAHVPVPGLDNRTVSGMTREQ